MRNVRIGFTCLLVLFVTWGGPWEAWGAADVGPTLVAPRVSWVPGADWPFAQFRVAQPRARDLVRTAWERSQTIRDLLSRLESSDVITFFALSPFLQLPTGRTSFLGMAGPNRCLNLVLNERNSEDDLIALLGHELHHVIEVSEAPDVHDIAGYERLYQRIGSTWSDGRFETRQAVEVWRQVRRDLESQEELSV
jgi:hypothetical protein